MVTIPIQTTTVNLATGETTEETKQAMLSPPPPGTCSICAVNHAEDHPHNAQSLYYQYAFYGEHGRWPNWLDAMAHCTEDMRRRWTEELEKRGVDVTGGKVNPVGESEDKTQ